MIRKRRLIVIGCVIVFGCIVLSIVSVNHNKPKPKVYNCDLYTFPGGDQLLLDRELYFYVPQKIVDRTPGTGIGYIVDGNSDGAHPVYPPYEIQGIKVTAKFLILKLKSGDGIMFIDRQYGNSYQARDYKSFHMFMKKNKIPSPVDFTPIECN